MLWNMKIISETEWKNNFTFIIYETTKNRDQFILKGKLIVFKI